MSTRRSQQNPAARSPADVSQQTLLEPFDSRRCRGMRARLERWFAKVGRPLPWRETRDPYRIWISEIMLQQTTVKAVIPYFERFLARFPTLLDLADASEAEVLQYWEGLGYYSRGRNLQRAAVEIRDRFQGEFPSELDELRALPGVGRYTAGAIRSFGFNLAAPIVEANTVRLYSRLLGFTGNPRSAAGQALLWKFAENLQPARQAGHLNQALMELGATLCTPQQPQCELCPLQRDCVAFSTDRQSEIPVKPARVAVTPVVECTIAVREGNKFLIRQRAADERWAGMWDFPRFPLTSVKPEEQLSSRLFAKIEREAAELLREETGIGIQQFQLATEITHSVTRFRIRLLCCTARTESTDESASEKVPERWRWCRLEELAGLPMPVTGRRFARLLSASD